MSAADWDDPYLCEAVDDAVDAIVDARVDAADAVCGAWDGFADVVNVCPFCRESVSPSVQRVPDPDDELLFWHRACWLLDHAAERVDFVGHERPDRVEREAAWQARGGRRGAGL